MKVIAEEMSKKSKYRDISRKEGRNSQTRLQTLCILDWIKHPDY